MIVSEAFATLAQQHPGRGGVPLVRGQLFPIRLYPDPINDDRITIGVGFIDAGGVTYCRVADEFARLECLYEGRVDVRSFVLASELICADLSGTSWDADRLPPVENIEYGPAVPQGGLSVDEILARAFDATVRFGIPKTSPQRQLPIRNDQLRQRLASELMATAPHKAKSLLNQPPIQVELGDGRVKRIPMALHSVVSGAAANVVSLASRQVETVRNNISNALYTMMQLRMGEKASASSCSRQLALFALDSGDNAAFDEDERREFEGLAKLSNVVVFFGESPSSLAGQALGWEPLAA